MRPKVEKHHDAQDCACIYMMNVIEARSPSVDGTVIMVNCMAVFSPQQLLW